MHRQLSLVAAAIAGIAITGAALQSTEASARPAQATSACGEPALAQRADPQARPTHLQGARRLDGRRVIVHYASSGPSAPPAADRSPANGVPDYVEKVRTSADAALAFFERPDFRGIPFQGFDTSFADTGGPDPRLDIYLAGPGRPLGRAVSPTRGEGGAFLLLSTSMSVQPREKEQRFRGDGIRFTVAHELFHLVQFNYVPSGMPLWIAEGTANTLAFMYEKADHPYLETEADSWLRRPDCALWYEGFNCERCYGGVWWWVTNRHLLRLYFDYLASHARDGYGVGRGIAGLEATFDSVGVPSVVTPYLYLDFAFSFAPASAAVAYSRARRRAPVTISVAARMRRTTRRLVLNPMAAHYIGVRAPANARALELVATGIGAPDPLQTLLVGIKRGKNRSVRTLKVAREVNPCVATFQPGYGFFANSITVNFRSARERSSLLVIANRTNRVVAYELSYRALAASVRQPSPTVPWGKPGVSLAPHTFCTKQLTGVTHDDPGDDAELGAPELTKLYVSLIRTTSNSRPLVGFSVEAPNRRELQTNEYVTVWVDTDRNTASGCAPYGQERAFLVAGRPGPDVSGIGRCVGGEMQYEQSKGTYEARFDEQSRRLVVLATPDDLDGSTAFNFRIDAFWRDLQSDEVRVDSVPNGDFVGCFPTCSAARLR